MNEIKLIIKCQKGEKEAFNELITIYYPYVSKFLIKLTADEEIAQDLVQETFLKLVIHIDKFDVKGKAMFSTYLMKIALEEYSLKEIAEKMGTKPKTIKSRIHEGKKKLEKRIKRGGNAYG